MARALDLTLAAGVVTGVVWYTRRAQHQAAAEARTATRIAEAVTARADARRDDELGALDGAPSHGDARRGEPGATHEARSAPTETRPGRPGLSRAFDGLFRAHGRGLPVAYLRALGHAESGLNPADRLGLINVVPIAVADYNRRHPSATVRAEQMTDPAVNVRVAADILRTIIASYRRHHPDVPALAEDWTRPAFVELLSFGWNAGFSERAGVGCVVRYLRRTRSEQPITLDTVADAASAAGAARTLSNPRKRAYCKGIAAAYVREVLRDPRDGLPIT
ncbi:MAG: hypothetical protein IPL61_12570 [Myxococcales bacterium]|nr:hypothetical protein [Myxococcales bacterium]